MMHFLFYYKMDALDQTKNTFCQCLSTSDIIYDMIGIFFYILYDFQFILGEEFHLW